jgi:uncharacterized protein with PQ loop repeat
MVKQVGVFCIGMALILELLSYWKQIAKTLRTKKSAHVSSTAYLLKLVKYAFTILGLISLQIPFTHILGANVKFTLYSCQCVADLFLLLAFSF